jgi:hypothetical protein
MEKDEALEKAQKAAVVSHRINQFFWGWCWALVLDSGLKMVGVQPTEMSPWECLAFFVLNGVMALHFQRKVLRVGFAFGKK